MHTTIVDPADLVRGWAKEYEREADERRRRWSADPLADAFAYVAADLEERAKQLTAAAETLSPAEYAAQLPADQRVTEQSVRNWIHRGELDAVLGPHGYRIPKGARRRKPRLRVVGE
jgi:hypothetical protein